MKESPLWDSFLMPKKDSKRKKANGIPKHGRSESDVMRDMGLRGNAADVPLGNTNPTVVRGMMYGGNPTHVAKPARGGLRQFGGKYT